VPLSRILTDRGTEYCGSPDSHEYELYLAVENIDHTRTKVKSPQPNGIVGAPGQAWLNKGVQFSPGEGGALRPEPSLVSLR
jgi:hypothetical protein